MQSLNFVASSKSEGLLHETKISENIFGPPFQEHASNDAGHIKGIFSNAQAETPFLQKGKRRSFTALSRRTADTKIIGTSDLNGLNLFQISDGDLCHAPLCQSVKKAIEATDVCNDNLQCDPNAKHEERSTSKHAKTDATQATFTEKLEERRKISTPKRILSVHASKKDMK